MKQAPVPIIIDIEASGFSSYSYPIEVGVVLSDGTKYCSLILPLDSWTHWDLNAEQAHGISRKQLAAFGKPPRQVAQELNELIGEETAYSDGWVVDKPWLIRLFHAAGIDMCFRLSPLELILSEQQMTQWHTTKNRLFNTSHDERHRASHDAWVIQQTFMQTLRYNPSSVVTPFVRRSARPAG